VYELTESALHLALVLVSFAVPQVALSLLGGVVADRFPKRGILTVGQLLNGLAALAMGYLVFSGNVRFSHFIVFGVLSGTILALSFPSRHAIVPDLVRDRLVFSAIALNSTAMNIARVSGPAFAGLLIAWMAGGDTSSDIGVGIVYFVIAGLYVGASLISGMISVPGSVNVQQTVRHVLSDMAEVLRFVRRHPTVWALVWLAIVPFMFGHSLNTFLPAFNEDVLNGGADSLGLLLSVMGVGSILGSLTLAAASSLRRKGTWLVVMIVSWGLAIFAFGFVQNNISAFVLVILIGWLSSSCMAMNRALTQMHTRNRMLGRVMSIDMMSHGLMPISAIPIGILADTVGTAFAISTSGVLLMVIVSLMLFASPSVRHLTKRD
ncbi:MAG: MFS transporter, partial [Gammaproteobacteria bacterium]|nr:MFS transporter [Gammaproteobacteria bacterium]